MALPSLLFICGTDTGNNRGRVWTLSADHGTYAAIKNFAVGSRMRGCVICCTDLNLYVAGLAPPSSGNTYDGIVHKFDGTTWSVEQQWTGGAETEWDVFDIVLYKKKLYVTQTNSSSSNYRVMRRDDAGTWYQVHSEARPSGGLHVLRNFSTGKEYLLAWALSNTTGNNFYYTEDGVNWSGSGTIASSSSFGYVVADGSNYRFYAEGDSQEYTSSSLGGTWTGNATSPGHNTPNAGRVWGDQYSSGGVKAFIGPTSETRIRRLFGSSWIDVGPTFTNAIVVDADRRSQWDEWNNRAYLVSNTNEAKIVYYDIEFNSWNSVRSDSSTWYSGVAGYPLQPAPIPNHYGFDGETDGAYTVTKTVKA